MRAALAIAVAATACGSPVRPPLEVDVLLNARSADDGRIGGLAADFDLSPDRLIVVSDHDRVYTIGWGGSEPMAALPAADSLAYTPDGLLLLVRGATLSYVDADGAPHTMFELPHTGMGLATGPQGVVYLFDRAAGDGRNGLYELLPGRRAVKLLESPAPIDAVAQAGARLLFASGGAVFEATGGHPLRLVANLRGLAIRSVAADDQRVYLSDGAAVYALAGRDLRVVTSTIGGSLRVRDGGLFVLDPQRRLLLRIAPR